MEAFREGAIMVGEQALEAIDYLKHGDYAKPAVGDLMCKYSF